MSPRSLRLRLLGGAAVAIFAALGIAWAALTLLFGMHLERRVAEDLNRDALQLVGALSVTAGGEAVLDGVPTDPRFATPASGLYWQLTVADRPPLRSRSLWDQKLPPPADVPADRWRLRPAAGPFGTPVHLLERAVRPGQDAPPVVVQLALDQQPVRQARAEFGLQLALFLGILWVLLSAAAWLQVQLGLRPLDRVRADLPALQRNPAARLPAAQVREIAPLTAAINGLAEAREQDLERARRRAADLAHSLKTPLAALAAQSRLARSSGAADAADGLDRAIAAVSAAVNAELRRTRSAALGGSSPVAATVDRVIGVVERTEEGARVIFGTNIPDALRVPMAADGLTELMGALIENAARFARRQVRVAAADRGEETVLAVEDDGPGLDAGRAETVLMRGGRLDESGPGSGLGLSIARDLVEQSGGRIGLCRSDLGGLCVTVAWPARPA